MKKARKHEASRVRGKAWPLVAALVLALGACAAEPPRQGAELPLRILAFNDFHGSLETPREGPGGAARLAALLREARASSPHSVTLSAGDLIGATPLISSLFNDEPTIEAATRMGLDFAAVGNHEFDRGMAELLRMQHGDADNGGGFAGAGFRYLAANVIVDATGETLFPAYALRRFQGIPVGFIGLTLEASPDLVTASGVSGLRFTREVEAINASVAELKAKGVEAIIVIIHQGGWAGAGGERDCDGFRGPLADIVAAADSAVDLFVTGHTHQRYLCRLDGRPVTSAGSLGRYYTSIEARLDPGSGDLRVVAMANVPVTGVAPAADIRRLVERHRAAAEEVSLRPVGRIGGELTREQNAAGESSLGAVIADAQLAATRRSEAGGARVAFMNQGGMRADLSVSSPVAGGDGEVTYGDLFAVHPFGNHLVTLSLTGAEIHALLELQWVGRAGPEFLSPSRGFRYTWREDAPDGERVDPASIRIDGEALRPGRSYRVTANSFLASGGDGFSIFLNGRERIDGGKDVDALERYLQAHSPIAPPELGRIRRQAGAGER